MPVFTEARLKKFAPNIHPDIMQAFLVFNADDLLIDAGIISALILQHFMGQTFVESAGYTTMTENLHYSAQRLMQVFGRSKFASIEVAEQYAGNPVKTANYVYGNRLGNKAPGDGWKYRGGGLIDTTGKSNYANMAKKTGLDLINHPDLIRDPSTALHIACQMFKALGAVEAAATDDGSLVTLRVNGGHNGAADRVNATDHAMQIFTDDPIPSEASDGFMSSYADAPEDADGHLSKPATVPLSTLQAKQLQQQLKDKNYSPGDINGDIHNPSTVGAIAELQKQQGIDVTGVVDDQTEDAIQDAPDKVVSDNRANETPASLRAKGSETIAAADTINTATHSITAGGIGSIGLGGASIIAGFNSQADQIRSVTDHIPGLSERIAAYLGAHLALLGLVIGGILLLYVSMKLYSANMTVITERVRKSQTGEDMSH